MSSANWKRKDERSDILGLVKLSGYRKPWNVSVMIPGEEKKNKKRESGRHLEQRGYIKFKKANFKNRF